MGQEDCKFNQHLVSTSLLTPSQLFKEATIYMPPSALAFDHITKKPCKAASTQGTNIEIHNHLGRDNNPPPHSDGQRCAPSSAFDISHRDSDDSELICYPPISEVLADLHSAMPLINYPCFEEALVNNSIVYANSVLNIGTEFFSTIVGMPVGTVHDFIDHAKRLVRCHGSKGLWLKVSVNVTCSAQVLSVCHKMEERFHKTRGVDDWIRDKVETGVSMLLSTCLNSATP
jgi:hypothetical protein